MPIGRFLFQLQMHPMANFREFPFIDAAELCLENTEHR